MRNILTVFGVAAAVVVAAGAASAQSIGIFADLEGSSCELQATVGAEFTFYILATIEGDAADGVTGAEFRVDGFPAAWGATIVENPAAGIVTGSPLGDGTNIAFSTCQKGTGGKLLLFTITATPTTNVSDMTLSVVLHNSPSNPAFQCPLVTLCDDPTYTKVCVCGGTAVVNGTAATCGCNGPSPAKESTWGHVKSLYQ